MSNAILFAHVMEFNKDACKERLAVLCDGVFPEFATKSVDEKTGLHDRADCRYCKSNKYSDRLDRV